jgi:glycerophosphoryl diester phosphodiesterase
MIRIVGHRGASGRAPENTVTAIRLGWQLGADAIEFDVRLTADGYPVLLHDATLDRTTSGAGPLSERTLAEVTSLDAGAWFDPVFAGERVPSLAEALAAVREASTLSWMIELKSLDGPAEPFVERVLAEIAASGAAPMVRLISFDEELLAAARERAPEIPRGMISGDDPARLLAAAERLDCVAVHAGRRILTAELVAAAHGAGRRVNAWTLNEPSWIRDAVELGVDEITTDLPDTARSILAGPGVSAAGP